MCLDGLDARYAKTAPLIAGEILLVAREARTLPATFQPAVLAALPLGAMTIPAASPAPKAALIAVDADRTHEPTIANAAQ